MAAQHPQLGSPLVDVVAANALHVCSLRTMDRGSAYGSPDDALPLPEQVAPQARARVMASSELALLQAKRRPQPSP